MALSIPWLMLCPLLPSCRQRHTLAWIRERYPDILRVNGLAEAPDLEVQLDLISVRLPISQFFALW